MKKLVGLALFVFVVVYVSETVYSEINQIQFDLQLQEWMNQLIEEESEIKITEC
jgi:hypothetical protein